MLATFEGSDSSLAPTTMVGPATYPAAAALASIDPVGLSYTPNAVEVAADGSVLLYSKTHQSIFRWDTVSQSYGDSIPLAAPAEFMAYSKSLNTIYLAYSSGQIRQIDLDAADTGETAFATLNSAPKGLGIAGPYIFAANGSAHSTYSSGGQLVEEVRRSYFSTEYMWSDANQKLYFLRDNVTPNDLLWEEINANGTAYPGEPPGGIRQMTDSPLHDSSGFTHPIRVAPDGSVVVLGSGQIHDAKTLARLTTPLANSIADATWLGDELYTIRTTAGQAEIQQWSEPSFGLSLAQQVPGYAYGLKTLDPDRLLAISMDAGGVPLFTVLDAELYQSDDAAGFTVEQSDGVSSVNESGTTDNLLVTLTTQPASEVVLSVSSGNFGEVTTSSPSLTFTPDNWNIPQTVTLIGVDDSTVDGNRRTSVTITVNVASSDPAFQDAPDQIVSVTTVDNETVVASVVEYDGVGYFLVKNNPRVERFDIANATWLTSIPLPDDLGPATVLQVDSGGLYVAYDKAVYRYGLDGSSATHLLDTPESVTAIHSDGNVLFINHRNGSYARLISVNKATNAVIGTFTNSSRSPTGSSIAPQVNRIFGRTSGVSPSDITYVSYTDGGTFVDGGDSPYHGAYPGASQTWVFPNGSKVVDSSGTIYSTSGLTWLGRMGTSIDDIDFFGDDIPIILQGNTLTAYSNTYLPTGSRTLAFTPDEIFVNATHVITFTTSPTLPSGLQVDLVPLSDLNPPNPGEPVSPVGLSYTPNAVEVASDGTVLLYSKAFQSIFRWDPVSQSYSQSIPLVGTAESMAYSASTNTVYLAYASGLIRQIDLDAAEPVETPFAMLATGTSGLAIAGPYVFTVDSSTHSTYAPNGQLVEAVRRGNYSTEYVWSEANQKMYFFRDATSPNDLLWQEINANGTAYPGELPGGIRQMIDSPLHTSSGFIHPIRVAPDGSVVVLGSGQIHDGTSLARLTTPLANSITDAAWLSDGLYTIRTTSGYSEIQAWSKPTYGLTQALQLPGIAYALETIAPDRLLAIMLDAGGVPVFTRLNAQLQELDNPSAGFSVEETDGASSVNESGTTDTLLVALNAQPASDVVLVVSSGDLGEVTASPATLTFTPDNWNISQVVTLTGVDEATLDGNQRTFVTISLDAARSDPAFLGAPDQVVSVNTIDNETEVSSVVEYNGAGYFLVKNNPRVERFDIASATWLTPIPLPDDLGPATVLHVDSGGLYVAYGKAVYRYGLDGSNATHLLNAPDNVRALHSDGNLLFVNHSISGAARLISVSKTTNTIIDTLDSGSKSLYGSAIAPQINRIFGRSSGISPADIAFIGYADDGTFISGGESPYHGTYPGASQTWVFPNGSKVVDNSGTIYSTSGLTWLGRMGTSIDDMDFLGEDIPIILQGNTLTAYSNAYLPTGSHTLDYTPDEIFVSATHVITFTVDITLPSGFQVDLVPLSDLNPSNPGQPVNPVGLSYTPDEVELAADGTVLLYSKNYQSVFRWDPVSQSYTQSIPLAGTAEYMTYSASANTIYLAYASGQIQQLDLDAAVPVETPFFKLNTAPWGLATAGPYVFAVDDSGAWVTHYTFTTNGQLVEAVEWNYYSTEYVWSDANQKMYFFRDDTSPNDLLWEEINANGTAYPGQPAGGIGQKLDSPLHNSNGFTHPIRVAPDGSVVVLGSGQIHDAKTLVRLATPLANSITDAAWLGGKLYTIRAKSVRTELQEWSQPAYAVTRAWQLQGTPFALKTLSPDRMLAITVGNGGVPFFTLMDAELHWVGRPLVNTGDANGDRITDAADYTVWADHYLQYVAGGPAQGDFNRDGYVDAADYTVWADHYLQLSEGQPIIGDANGDRVVNAADYTVWADFYLQRVVGGPALGDFNGDGIVDSTDYTIWADAVELEQALETPAAAALILPATATTSSETSAPVEHSSVWLESLRSDIAWAASVDGYFLSQLDGYSTCEALREAVWRPKRRTM